MLTVALSEVPARFLDPNKWAELRAFAKRELIALTYINAPFPDENDPSAFFWGRDVPLHFSAFHPAHRMLDTPPTPPETLRRAHRIATQAGLDYVYLGNVHDADGDTTFCPQCHERLIVRDWYQIERHALAQGGFCPGCGATIVGRFDGGVGSFGRHRIPVAIGQ